MLREQLEQATSANQQLTLDIQKLTNDWNKAREELDARDEEEQAYFANEHVRLMDMWKTVNNFRRQFNEMKSATQRYFLPGVGVGVGVICLWLFWNSFTLVSSSFHFTQLDLESSIK